MGWAYCMPLICIYLIRNRPLDSVFRARYNCFFCPILCMSLCSMCIYTEAQYCAIIKYIGNTSNEKISMLIKYRLYIGNVCDKMSLLQKRLLCNGNIHSETQILQKYRQYTGKYLALHQKYWQENGKTFHEMFFFYLLCFSILGSITFSSCILITAQRLAFYSKGYFSFLLASVCSLIFKKIFAIT